MSCVWKFPWISLHSLACVSQHPVCLWEAWSADNRDNGVETHTHKYTQERLGERATGGTLSCVLSMKSQPVRMSHIPGSTKEEVGLSPLSDTAGVRLHVKRNRKMEKEWKRVSLGRFLNFYLPPSSLTRQTSLLQPFPLPPSASISLSRFLWTCCLIRCPFIPINTVLGRQNEVIEPAWASHTQTWTRCKIWCSCLLQRTKFFNKFCMLCYVCAVATDIFQWHKCGVIPNKQCVISQILSQFQPLISAFFLCVYTDLNVCPSFLIVG